MMDVLISLIAMVFTALSGSATLLHYNEFVREEEKSFFSACVFVSSLLATLLGFTIMMTPIITHLVKASIQ